MLTMSMLLIAACLHLSACSIANRELPPLDPPTDTELRILSPDGSYYAWKISDPKQLSQVIAFVDSHRSGWEKSWRDVPAATVEVRFWSGDKTIGSFGAGANFFEVQRDSVFFTRTAASDDIRAFYSVVGVDDEILKKYTTKEASR